MAVAFDAKSVASQTAAGPVSTFTVAASGNQITVGSGSNRALICYIQFGALVTGVTCVWDAAGTNQSMTNIGHATSSDNLSQSYLFGLVAPTSGQKTITVSWTTATDYLVGCASFTNVDQTGGATTFKNFNTVVSSLGNGTITITTANGDMAVAGISSSPVTFSTFTAGTLVYVNNTNVSGIAGYLAAVGASTTITASNGTGAYAIAGCDITQFTAAAALPIGWVQPFPTPLQRKPVFDLNSGWVPGVPSVVTAVTPTAPAFIDSSIQVRRSVLIY